MCVDIYTRQIFANSQLVAVLYDLMADKQEDDEMVLQVKIDTQLSVLR